MAVYMQKFDDIGRAQQSASSLEAALAAITRCVNEKRDHIPPVVSSSTVTFPFDITMTG